MTADKIAELIAQIGDGRDVEFLLNLAASSDRVLALTDARATVTLTLGSDGATRVTVLIPAQAHIRVLRD